MKYIIKDKTKTYIFYRSTFVLVLQLVLPLILPLVLPLFSKNCIFIYMENLWNKNLILSSKSLKVDTINYHKINAIFDKFEDEFNKTTHSLQEEMTYKTNIKMSFYIMFYKNIVRNYVFK